jgi:hypothetical protein
MSTAEAFGIENLSNLRLRMVGHQLLNPALNRCGCPRRLRPHQRAIDRHRRMSAGVPFHIEMNFSLLPDPIEMNPFDQIAQQGFAIRHRGGLGEPHPLDISRHLLNEGTLFGADVALVLPFKRHITPLECVVLFQRRFPLHLQFARDQAIGHSQMWSTTFEPLCGPQINVALRVKNGLMAGFARDERHITIWSTRLYHILSRGDIRPKESLLGRAGPSWRQNQQQTWREICGAHTAVGS